MALHNQLIQQSREYLAKGDLEKALKYLLFVAKTFERTRAYRQLVVLYRSHEGLEVHLNAGTIDPDFAALQNSRTRQKLQKMADEMEAELRLENFEVKVKITGGSVDKKVSDWVQSLFA
ncbi:MAG TPA: hypothetical protein VK168_12455 [Saprospiraceae bacterium]|nr:hypothetical protein [Saprospiraceae bacterium]